MSYKSSYNIWDSQIVNEDNMDLNELRLQALAEASKRNLNVDYSSGVQSTGFTKNTIDVSDALDEAKKRGLMVDSQYNPESVDAVSNKPIKSFVSGILDNIVKSAQSIGNTYTKAVEKLPFQKEAAQIATNLRSAPEQGAESGQLSMSHILGTVIPEIKPLMDALPERIKQSESSVASINFLQRLPAEALELGLELIPLTPEEAVWYAALGGLGKLVGGGAKNIKLNKFIKMTSNEVSGMPAVAGTNPVGIVPYKESLPGAYKVLKTMFKEDDPDKLLHGIMRKISTDYESKGAQAEMLKKVVIGLDQADSEMLEYTWKALGEKLPATVKQQSFLDAMKYQFIQTGDTTLRKSGVWGDRFASILRKVQSEGEVKAGSSIESLKKTLSSLSDNDIKLFADVAEGKASTQSPNLIRAVDEWTKLYRDVGTRSSNAGLTVKSLDGTVKPFQPIEKYFPHYHLQEISEIPEAQKTKILGRMVESGQAKNISEAEGMLRTQLTKQGERRISFLQKTREIDIPGYETDPRKVLPQYIKDTEQRLAQAKYLGADDKIANELMTRISQEGGSLTQARNIFDAFVGKVHGDSAMSKINETVTGLELVSKMGLGAITNTGQTVNTIALAGIKNTIQGLKDMTTVAGKEYIARSGAILSSMVDDMVREGSAGSKFLKANMFTGVEQFNRSLAASAGKHWVKDLTAQLMKNPQNKYLLRQFKKLELDPIKILKRNGVLSDGELLQAGNMVARITQFKTGALDLPAFFQSPNYKIITQFKSFAVNQTKFIKDNIINEAGKGNIAPLLRMAVFGQIAGEGIQDIKSFIRGKKRTEGFNRLLDNYAQVAAFGLAADSVQAAKYGVAGSLSFLAGAALTDLAKGMNAMSQLSQGKPKAIAKFGLDQLPIAGQAIAGTPGALAGAGAQALLKNRLFPPKETASSQILKSGRHKAPKAPRAHKL
jgi:hypothetical protein